MRLKSLLMEAGLLTSSALLAETWTGVQDGRWTNAANWAEGTVPGFTSEATELPDAHPELRLTTRAIFDGAFAESDITATGTSSRPELRDAFVVQDGRGIRLRVPHGMLMIIR